MARTFNGSSQYLTVSSGFGLGANDARTIVGWFWKNASSNYCYASMGVAGTGTHRHYMAGTAPKAESTSSSGTFGSATGSDPGNGAWFHLAGEFLSNSLRAINVNGVRTTNTTTVTLSTAPDVFRVGVTPGTTAYLAGRAAYVALYSGTLTSQELEWLSGLGVAANAYAPGLVATDRLLGYWPLDGSASPEPDEFGSNDLTLVGTPGSATSPSIILSGAPGGVTVLPQGWWA